MGSKRSVSANGHASKVPHLDAALTYPSRGDFGTDEAWQDAVDRVDMERDRLGVPRSNPISDRRKPDSPAPRKRSARTLPPFKPFPVEALPTTLRVWVEQAASSMRCSTCYLALPVLSVVASLIGNTRTIRLKRGWDEPAIVWTCIVGDSGTLKSPAFAKATGYIYRLQRLLIKEHKAALAAFQDELETWKAKKREAKESGKDPGPEPEPPTLSRIVLSDVTIEKLAEVLEDNPRGTLVARDELAGWLGSFSRYKGKAGGSDLPNWLELHRAGTIMVDRKTGERRTLLVPHASVSISGSIQPGALVRSLTQNFLDSGLAARLLLAMPPKQAKSWTDIETDPEIDARYHELLEALKQLDMDRDREGERVPFSIRLTPEAKVVWVKFYDAWAKEQASVEGELAAAYSKLEAYAARFALIHHVVTRIEAGADDSDPIDPVSILAGITLCRWFAGEAIRVYSTLTESDQERDTRRLMEFIAGRGGRMTARTLQRSNSRKYPTSEHAEGALDTLAADGLGHWEASQSTLHGGHPVKTLVLNPTHDTTDTRPDADEAPGAAFPDTRPDSAQEGDFEAIE